MKRYKIDFKPENHEYRINNIIVPSVTQAMNEAGFDFWSGARPDVLRVARKFGRAFHKARELYDNNDLLESSLDPALAPFLQQWIRAKNDLKIKVLKSELIVYSPIYMTAGTMDILAVYQKELTVVELKTYEKEYDTVAMQTAGYQGLYNELNPKKKIKDRLAINLTADDYHPHPLTDMADWPDFLSCVRLAHRKRRKNLLKGDN